MDKGVNYLVQGRVEAYLEDRTYDRAKGYLRQALRTREIDVKTYKTLEGRIRDDCYSDRELYNKQRVAG